MKSKVYFIDVSDADGMQVIKQKFARLLKESRILDFILKGDKVAVKMHFGEEGNTGYVRPEYVRLACADIRARQAECFLSDTNTLYRGRRMNSRDYLELAYEHGFIPDACAAEVIIPDDSRKENVAEIALNRKFVQTAKVVKLFLQADALVGIAHFKGHMMTGFGGALKNIGMGCASREGKLAQHSGIAPYVILEKCIACKECGQACPAEAIFIKNKLAYIDPARCIGCASCIAACRQNAIEIKWEAGGSRIQEKMTEYALAVLKDKLPKSAFINFAVKITKECDCLAKDDPRIVPDVGILASRDPVSVDQASLDLVNQAAGKDIFKEAHPLRNGLKQLEHASKLGLGSREYEVVQL